ncbi:hypothetical protein C1H46_000725 [Malus baccata]|uniref:Uncharacterized protein n=1 Tax=Malus baccata TaxID=106549 RepID=A0A540NRQ3_MALBA|nr:hypothetical protein C1H46_000725 [Malus baccata]
MLQELNNGPINKFVTALNCDEDSEMRLAGRLAYWNQSISHSHPVRLVLGKFSQESCSYLVLPKYGLPLIFCLNICIRLFTVVE